MIVITTPTGLIGHQVLHNLLNSDEPIRVIVRDPSRLSPREHERVEVVQGSHGDLDVVTRAFTGADSVFWLVPRTPTLRASRPPTWTSAGLRATLSRARGSSGWLASRPSVVGQQYPGKLAMSRHRWPWTT
nr:NAD(P)H-binding protein [Ktedonobacter sp. SOSP1-52]